MIEVKKMVEEQEIWDEEKEVAKFEEKAKKLVFQRFYKQIHVFVSRKGKVYLLLRKKRGEMHKFIEEQLRKEYIRLLKSSQMVSVFFVRKKDSRKHIVQDYWYLNEQTIKNNYCLPLISDIVENIGIKKVFTKLDL